MLKLGLIINPFAGLGGSAGLKGSDGADIILQAQKKGIAPRSPLRATRALECLAQQTNALENVKFFCYDGAMGADVVRSLGFGVTVIGASESAQSCAQDSYQAAQKLAASDIDLLLFAGGDGTARDIYRALSDVRPELPVLGIPAGVKMHSAVYAINPEAAGAVLSHLYRAEPVLIGEREVRDIDEEKLRAGSVQSKYYGELSVPELDEFIQQVKNSGRTPEPLILADIAAEIIDQLDEDTLTIFGPGSTTKAVLDELSCDAALLGVNAYTAGTLVGCDLDGAELLQLVENFNGPVRLLLSVIGGQGHIIGRGNQQLLPEILRSIGKANIQILAVPSKLEELNSRPFLIDTNDPQLDQTLSGFYTVVTGYRQAVLYPAATTAETMMREH